MKRKNLSRLLNVGIVIGLLFSIFSFSSCSTKDENIKQIMVYLESLDNTNIKIDKVLLSEKFIANPDSVEIEKYILNIKDTSVSGIEQKMKLLNGNEMYFSDFWNKGDINEKQIKNIQRVSTQYHNIRIKPSSYILFTLIQCSDVYGQKQVLPLAFLMNDKNEILKHRRIEVCDELLDMFKKKEVEQLLKQH